MPLSPDEAYYWVWSKALAWGYPDHPPMVAVWIRIGTAIAGEGALGVRLLAPLAAALGSVLLVHTANRLFPAQRPGVRAAWLLNATLMFGGAGVTMTPDTPLLLFWIASMHAVSIGWWPLAGLMAGLALDSKYTAILLAPAFLAWLALHGGLRRPGPWLAAGVAGVVFAPVVAWNAAHNWVSFAKQGGRVADWQPVRALQFLGELVGGQVGLATPLLAVVFVAGAVVALRRWRQPGWGLLAALLVVPGLVFLQHALGDRVQANWPGVMYPAAAMAGAMVLPRWHAPAMGLGGALMAVVLAQAMFAPLALPVERDPTLLRLGGWEDVSRAVEAAREADGGLYLAADNYGVASMLARGGGATPVLGVEERWQDFALADGRVVAAGQGLLVRSARRADAPTGWAEAVKVGHVARARGGRVAEVFLLYRVRGAEGPAAVMPTIH